ncbi:hypothetical protein [Knoellia koreensis]|uniref:Uncharacterized protein n=1 Tax=Knoellia koreensis TaxID=2730921 RepID=A0A849HMG9_9MICO|nr:hypothetical protein [Knoellia sp. DB2414S]NNM47863.1 hypothetical protein [Knoellia sp. DB2414S]
MSIAAHPLTVDAELAYKADLLSHADGSHPAPVGSQRSHVLRRSASRLRALLREFARELAQGACPTVGPQHAPRRS